jgi:hypothetical protein
MPRYSMLTERQRSLWVPTYRCPSLPARWCYRLRCYFFFPTRFMNFAPICTPLTQDNSQRR